MHPRLLWDTIIAATVTVLTGRMEHGICPLLLTAENVPGHGSSESRLGLVVEDVSTDLLNRLRRTYEPSRLIEMAAIAVAALTLHHAGGHEIVDLSVRGSGADYLVDAANHRLEVAGRSRRVDLAAAWEQKRHRLAGRVTGGHYVSVTEFETPASRLGFVV